MMPRTLERDMEDASPSLNLDVLRRILYFLPAADLKQAALVSRTVYEEAIREILIRGVRFDGPTSKLEIFCRFMLRRDPPLFSFLRRLEIVRVVASDNFDTSSLLQVLSRATYLSELRIHWSENDSPNPFVMRSLTSIFPALQSLRRLRLCDCPSSAYKDLTELLLNLPSQIRNLEVTFNHVDLNQLKFPHTLGMHLTKLCSLRIHYPDLARPRWEPFRTVRHLFVLWPDSISLSLRLLVQTFPALRELYLSLGRPGKYLDADALPPSQDNARADALEFQASGGGWPRLLVLSTTTVAEAWMLGLACRVGAVRMGAYDVARHATFVDVIARVRPVKVTMALECAVRCMHPAGAPRVFNFPDPHSNNVGASVASGTLRAVTHAVVFIVVPLHTGGADSPGIVETIGSHLKHSGLDYLHVVIPPDDKLSAMTFMQDERHIYQYVLRARRQAHGVTDSDPSPSSSEPHPAPSGSRFQEIDIPLLVSGLASAGRHLRTIALTIADRGQSVWRIDRSAGGQTRMISRIADPVSARAVVAREERGYIVTESDLH
ncbi:hypothetical protein V8D89_005428 [Ganoderma adspersum]